MSPSIEEMQQRKTAIEEQLLFEIARAVSGFKEQFGLEISSVTVHMVDATELGSDKREYLVSSVELRVEV